MRRKLLLLLVPSLPLSIGLSGATIVSITGDHSAFESGDSSEWSAQGWTQAASYTDVVIRATVFQELIGTPNGDGFAFLERKVGNHAELIDSTTFDFPANPSEDDPRQIVLFSGLSLGPGTYYLAIYGEGFWTAEFVESGPTIMMAPDVSNVTDTLISTNSGNRFTDTNNETFQDFRVTGKVVDSVNAPEPPTGAIVTATLSLVAFRHGRQVARS